MEQRPLGESGLHTSVIGLGTWAMGGAEESWGRVDDRESTAAIHAALDRGINLIDTAPVYGLGHSEDVIGKALLGRRRDVLLATKCGLRFPRSPHEAPTRCLSPDFVRTECENSLRRLRTDVIDVYQCHWPDPDTPIRATMEALTQLRHEGKIRAIGMSNFSCDQLAAAREFGPVHAVQPAFSMLDTSAADDLLPFSTEHRMAVLAYSPLAKGLLAGHVTEQSPLNGIRSRDPEFLGKRLQRNLRLVDALRPIAAGYGKTLTQLVLNWTVAVPGITAALVGARRPSQIEENAGAAGWSLHTEDLTLINSLVEEHQLAA